MGTLAAMFRDRGYIVTGSDATAYPPMSTWLEERGIEILSGYEATHIPDDVDLVVVGNVARRDNPEAVATIKRGIPYLSLPEALRVFFFADRDVIVISGTHGKTTTTAMTAWILHANGVSPSFFLGGVTINFDASYLLGDGRVFVVEGDEYDTAYFDKVPKVWHYPAKHATINNVEYDHADIYPDMASIRVAFQTFAEQVDPRGSLWVNGDDEEALGVSDDTWADRFTFGLGQACTLRGEVLGVGEDGTSIRVHHDGATWAGVLPTIGAHNVRNFLGAAAMALTQGVSVEQSLAAMTSYRGVRKRQEIKGDVGGVVVIDDFAHHPSALRETLAALRARYRSRRMWAIFEAKSNTSRRAVFQDAYAESFVDADVVVLSRPWRRDDLPAEELLSITRLADDIGAGGKEVHVVPEVDDIVAMVAREARAGDVIAGLSGSAFGGLHDKILRALKRRDDVD